jgi:hypothetical protein
VTRVALFITNQLNHSNHLSRQAPTKLLTTQHVMNNSGHFVRENVFKRFGHGRGQGITTHSIPRGERSGNRRLAKGHQHFDSPVGLCR